MWLKGKPQGSSKRSPTNLVVINIFLQRVSNMFIRNIREPALQSRGFIIGESLAESLRAVIECIAKGLMDAVQAIAAGHEHLFLLRWVVSSVNFTQQMYASWHGCVSVDVRLGGKGACLPSQKPWNRLWGELPRK